MPLPGWLGTVNKHVFNKRELRNGVRPVLHHIGRTSGSEYHTPLATFPITTVSGDQSYLFVMNYGHSSDWVRNVLASGHARLQISGRAIELDTPHVLSIDEATALAPTIKPPPRFVRVTEVLHMSTVGA